MIDISIPAVGVVGTSSSCFIPAWHPKKRKKKKEPKRTGFWSKGRDTFDLFWSILHCLQLANPTWARVTVAQAEIGVSIALASLPRPGTVDISLSKNCVIALENSCNHGTYYLFFATSKFLDKCSQLNSWNLIISCKFIPKKNLNLSEPCEGWSFWSCTPRSRAATGWHIRRPSRSAQHRSARLTVGFCPPNFGHELWLRKVGKNGCMLKFFSKTALKSGSSPPQKKTLRLFHCDLEPNVQVWDFICGPNLLED